MLHILWMVVKFILIVLGILLGLLLLALLLLLFCPVRYRAAAAKPGDAPLKEVRANGNVSWLFRLISVRLLFQDGSFARQVRIFGIPLEKFRGLRKKKRPEKTEPEEEEQQVPEQETEVYVSQELSGTAEQEAEVDASEKSPGEPGISGNSPEGARFEERVPAKESGLRKLFGLPGRLLHKILSFPRIIIDKIKKITLTFRSIYDKIDWWKQLFNHPRTRAALSLVWKDGKGLVKHVLPTKIEGKVAFGSEDPALTGAVLAFLGMSIPLHKNCIAVTPLFENENVLEGDVRLRGRIYGWIFLKTVAEIYFNKNVKYTIGRLRHKEG